MNFSEKIYQHLCTQVNHTGALRIFTALVYLWFPINILLLYDVKDLLWGVDNVFYRHGHTDGFIENFFYQLVYDATRFRFIFFTHLIAAFLSVIQSKWSFIPRIITWCTAWILFYAAIEAFNSGMMIMISLALYASVIHPGATHPIRILWTNLARYACIIQISLVYFTAAIFKLSGEQWLAGDAFYYTVHIRHFASDFWISEKMLSQSWILAAITWAGLLYQLIFPVMVWVKKGRTLFLIAGIFFHLFIGLFLHLWDFASAMIFCYAIFMHEKTAERILRLIPRKR